MGVTGPNILGLTTLLCLQSLGMDIFIPSTPEEAYLHTKNTIKNKNPSVILEHRWLYLNDQNFKTSNHFRKIHRGMMIKNNKSKI